MNVVKVECEREKVYFRRPTHMMPGPLPAEGECFKADPYEVLDTAELEELYRCGPRFAERNERPESSYRFRRFGDFAVLTLHTKPHRYRNGYRRGTKIR